MVDRGWGNCIDMFFSMLNFFFGTVLLKSWVTSYHAIELCRALDYKPFFTPEFTGVEPFALRLPENADLIAHHQAADQL
jgi:hypothetical protein